MYHNTVHIPYRQDNLRITLQLDSCTQGDDMDSEARDVVVVLAVGASNNCFNV